MDLYPDAAHARAHEAEARERLTRLAHGAGRLLGTLTADSVVQGVVQLAQESMPADGYAVWRRHDDMWAIEASAGIDPEFASARLPADTSTSSFVAPIVAQDVATLPMLSMRREAYERAGIRSLLSIPLAVRGEPAGSVVYYYREPHQPTDIDLQIALALGHLAAAAISSAELHAEQQALRQQALRAGERSSFLAEISARLNSLDYETNLQRVAKLAVPTLADWCVVDLLDEGGTLSRLAVAHIDPAKVEFAREMHRRYPPPTDGQGGLARVLRTGRAELFAEISDELLVAEARDPEHLQLLRDVGLRSAMLVPLSAGDEVFGVLTFASASSTRRYDEDDLAFAADLARRASFAIENARLYRQAQEANRFKDEFLAALSHELRTPLNAIIGWANLLRTTPSDQLQRGLEVIERNARVQSKLIDDLLDASRIASGKMTLDLADTDLCQALDASVAAITPAAAAKQIRVDVVMPRRQCIVRGDIARLQQVLWNILSNAVKFTPSGGRVRAEVVLSPRAGVVRITDSGVGIAPEFLPFIFDRFRQADASTTRTHPGLGLGLTLARQLTEMQGGRISASSDGVGTGAAFTVEFPLVESSRLTTPTSRPEGNVNVFAGRRILVVDDDPDSLEFLKRFLSKQRAEVATASSAAEGLLVLQRTRPDLLISDLAMPDHDGHWLVEQVRRLAPNEGGTIPAIALSAFASAAARERALAAGFTAHLGKPLNPDELRSLLYVTCGWRGPAAEARVETY
jgi:signal transduction histidine kinase/CheY-like chemotaxis protein